MSVATKELIALAARQHSAITDAQLKLLGISGKQRRRLVAEGWLERVLDGTYRVPLGADAELARCVAACARPCRLVIAGPTAGRQWHLRRMGAAGRIFVIGPPGSNPSAAPWLVTYRTSMLAEIDIVHRPDGIRLTSPPRTAVDLMRYLPPHDVRSVVDQMINDGLCTVNTMRRVAEPLATPGRPWARRFLELLADRPNGGVAESHWESRVAAALVERGGAGTRAPAVDGCSELGSDPPRRERGGHPVGRRGGRTSRSLHLDRGDQGRRQGSRVRCDRLVRESGHRTSSRGGVRRHHGRARARVRASLRRRRPSSVRPMAMSDAAFVGLHRSS